MSWGLAGEDDHACVGPASHRVRERGAGAVDLAVTAFVAELTDQVDHLTEGGGTEGFALGQEPAAGVDGQPAAELVVTGVEEVSRTTRWAEAELLAGLQLPGRVGVLTLDHMEVVWPQAGFLVCRVGGQGRRSGHIVVYETGKWRRLAEDRTRDVRTKDGGGETNGW